MSDHSLIANLRITAIALLRFLAWIYMIFRSRYDPNCCELFRQFQLITCRAQLTPAPKLCCFLFHLFLSTVMWALLLQFHNFNFSIVLRSCFFCRAMFLRLLKLNRSLRVGKLPVRKWHFSRTFTQWRVLHVLFNSVFVLGTGSLHKFTTNMCKHAIAFWFEKWRTKLALIS